MTKKYLLLAAMMLLPLVCQGQGKIYTRKAKLEDFPTRTTRVVLSGNEMMDALLKEEVGSRWRISPFEFCTVADYDAEKESSLYYFLRFTRNADFTWLTISKGGKSDDADPLKAGFDVISVPVAPAGFRPGMDLPFLPAYLDILQTYITKAQESEKVAFRGLKGICTKTVGKIYFDPEAGLEAFLRGEEGANATVVIPSENPSGKGWEMLIATDTHELRSIKRK